MNTQPMANWIATLRILCCAAALVATGPIRAYADAPNLVVIMADDLGFSDLGCYGGEIKTPHLDRLAAGGIQFTHFYNTAKCDTARESILSGLYHTEVNRTKLEHCATFAELLGDAGYTTMMVGKWHLDGHPMDRGFGRYFGHLSGATNFFTGDNTFYVDRKKFDVPKTGFYTTDAKTDYAIRFLDEAKKKEKPFLLYIAYNAPHYPLHAHEEDVKRYRGKYLAGWDALRKARYERQLKLGVVKPEWKLSPWPDKVRIWDNLSEKEKDAEDFTMAAYAAMVDRLDQNIGRLTAKLDALGFADNTLVMFMSDNGGCPFDRTRGREHPPWDPKSYWCYHEAWAGVSNTPFRWYKQNNHEGGIASPMIAHWPNGIAKGGTKSHQHGHLIDIMATALDVADVEYPKSFNGKKIKPLRGRSLVPIFEGKQREPHDAIFWQFSNNRAVRTGKWKLASARGGPWELYDMEADRTELDDLAAKHPERAEAMAQRWAKWAKETGLKQRGKQGKKNRDKEKEKKKVKREK